MRRPHLENEVPLFPQHETFLVQGPVHEHHRGGRDHSEGQVSNNPLILLPLREVAPSPSMMMVESFVFSCVRFSSFLLMYFFLSHGETGQPLAREDSPPPRPLPSLSIQALMGPPPAPTHAGVACSSAQKTLERSSDAVQPAVQPVRPGVGPQGNPVTLRKTRVICTLAGPARRL